MAALLCAPASAQVFETAGAAAPVAPVSGSIGSVMGAGASLSPISVVPGASILAPSLNTGAVIKAFTGSAATNSNLPAGAVRLAPAPLPALPAAAAASAAPAATGTPRRESAQETSVAPARRELMPPANPAGNSSVRAVAADKRRGSESDGAPEVISARLEAAGQEVSTPQDEAGGFDHVSAEGAVALGRKIFDRAGDRALLSEGSAAGTPGAPALAAAADGPTPERRDPLLAAFAGGSPEGEALRDAVASPVPASVSPATLVTFFHLPASLFKPAPGSLEIGAPAAGVAAYAPPVTFERLSLELGSGLVVKVRAALGFAPAPATANTFDGAAKGTAPSSARRPRVPITSTEWLERRGLLESISVSEAAASQEAAALPSPSFADAPVRAAATWFAPAYAPAPRSTVVPALVLDPAAPARVPPFAWWGLAFLPAGLVLLKELL